MLRTLTLTTLLAAPAVAADYSHLCREDGNYQATAEGAAAADGNPAVDCDTVMEYFSTTTDTNDDGTSKAVFQGLDFSSPVNCAGKSFEVFTMANHFASKCCGTGNAESKESTCWRDYSYVCKGGPSEYSPDAKPDMQSDYTCDYGMAYHTASGSDAKLTGADFSQAFDCDGKSKDFKDVVDFFGDKCCGDHKSVCGGTGTGKTGYEWAWTTADTKDICAGIITNCNDKATCTAVGVGPCEGTAKEPKAFLASYFVGLAMVKEATYLANEKDEDHAKVIDPTGPGYRDYKRDVPAGDSSASRIFFFFSHLSFFFFFFLVPPHPSPRFCTLFFFPTHFLTHTPFHHSSYLFFRLCVHHVGQHLW